MNHSIIRAVISTTFLIALFSTVKVEAQATIRRVPADHPTIQQAISASVNGDTVLVAPGTYVENINFLGKAITVTSEAGPLTTIIDGNNSNSVVTMHSGEGATSVLSGFTLRNGNANASSSANFEGGGVNIQNSSPTITGNIVSNNRACNGGGGIGIGFGSPLIQGNTITGNSQGGCSGGIGGGGISVGGFSSAQIIGNTITNNSWSSGGGISLFASGPTVIRNNTISNNNASVGGGIVMFNFSPAEIVQNIITGNSASRGGGIFWSNAPASVVNNTIVDNNSPQGSGIHASNGSPQANLFNNIIVGPENQTAVFCVGSGQFAPIFRFTNAFSPQGVAFGGGCGNQAAANGNIVAAPLFAGQSAGDYHLLPNSPAVDAGDNTAPNLPPIDLDGNPRIQDGNGDGSAVVDMGAYEALPPAPPFDICIEDDSSGSNLRLNSITGDYQFTNCSGFTLSGMGGLISRGGIITLQHNASDRRVLARIDTAVSKGTASIQVFSQATTFAITDRNTANNTCACAPQ